MAITPINGISFGNSYNNVTPKNQENEKPQNGLNQANKMVSIPVALWMTLLPQISTAQDVLPSPKLDEAKEVPTLVEDFDSGVEVVKENPYYLQEEYLRREEQFSVDGKNYTMYYMDLGANEFENGRVGGIYIVPEDFELVRKNGMELNSPMEVVEVVYHKGESLNETFVSAVVIERVCEPDGSNEQKIVKEIRLADEVGDELMDLKFGHSDFHLAHRDILGFRVVEGDRLMKEYVAPTKVLELDDAE